MAPVTRDYSGERGPRHVMGGVYVDGRQLRYRGDLCVGLTQSPRLDPPVYAPPGAVVRVWHMNRLVAELYGRGEGEPAWGALAMLEHLPGGLATYRDAPLVTR